MRKTNWFKAGVEFTLGAYAASAALCYGGLKVISLMSAYYKNKTSSEEVKEEFEDDKD